MSFFSGCPSTRLYIVASLRPSLGKIWFVYSFIFHVIVRLRLPYIFGMFASRLLCQFLPGNCED
jgi:hypothetical protein